jgi:glyoxylase-like metal-dependent hydrolase (beta-lactamase superfamily II)
VRVIDVMHLGVARVIGCWEVDGVLIDPGPTSCLDTLLDALEQPPRALLLTHIHLDHAGASGSLVERWPELDVYVHERGVAHMVDPSKLMKSASRLYGEDMDRLWGEMVPVPERNIRPLEGGERLLDGAFEVAYTPGHASHHVSYLHGATAFVGDVAGVRITPATMTVPPTPPPDIDVAAWHESIERITAWSPERLAMTHFGESEDVETQLAELGRRLDEYAERARAQELEEFVAALGADLERGVEEGLIPAYKQAAPPNQLYLGLERYWRKRADSVPPAEGAPVS